MADAIPHIVMAFASPDNDLDFMDKEELLLTRKFNAAKGKNKDFDFVSIRKATREDVLDSFAALKEQPPCFFHFSGHANGIVLNWQDGQSPTSIELSKLLLDDNIKIVFLNGCSTQPFVEQILKTTKVKAIVATRCPVNDEIAQRISIEFYTDFVINRYTLKKSFDNLCSKPEFNKSCIDDKGYNVTREIGLDNIKKLDDDKQFSWGLFYSDPNILFCRFTDLTSKLLEQLSELQALRDKARAELDKHESDLSGMEVGSPGRDTISGLAEKARKNLDETREKIRKLIQRDSIAGEAISEKEKQSNLKWALERLNYEPQRNAYLFNSVKFGGIAVSGDQYSFHELLCYNFRWENKIGRDNTFDCIIDATSRNYEGFWKKLALETRVEMLEPTTPTEPQLAANHQENVAAYRQTIVKKLMEDYYFETDEDLIRERPTQRDVLIKIKIGMTSVNEWIKTITDFWTEVQVYLKNSPYKPADDSFVGWHKMVVLLLDDSSTAEKHQLLKEEFEKISFSMPSMFRALDPITPLQKAELVTWIANNRLHTIGLNEQDADEWYVNSEQGKLIKLVYLLKDKTRYNDIEIFQILSREPIK